MKHFQMMGKYFGYPQCCIDEFCTSTAWDDNQLKVSYGTGFKPCRAHAKQIAEGELKLNDLIKDRYCSLPFPIQWDEFMAADIQKSELLKMMNKVS